MDISGTRGKKLPDATTIRWIELIAQILGFAIRIRAHASQDLQKSV
jgi:hypothetical protein